MLNPEFNRKSPRLIFFFLINMILLQFGQVSWSFRDCVSWMKEINNLSE